MINDNIWMGISKDGIKLMISHANLMDWAYKNDKQFTVGWARQFMDDKGNRLVRGDYVSEAKTAGWNDLVQIINDHLNVSGPQPSMTDQTNE